VLDDAAFGAAPSAAEARLADRPAARWTAAAGGLAYYAYCDNYLIDVEHAGHRRCRGHHGRAPSGGRRGADHADPTAETFGLWPERLIADTGYGSAAMLGWLVEEAGIEPHIPVFDKSQRTDGTFSRSDFTYDHERDLLVCPGGKELRHYRRQFTRPRIGVDAEGLMRYRATQRDCGAAR
jgi:hypothetical protein